MTDALGTSLLFDVFALNQAVGRFLAEAMRDGPLTPAEYAVYSAIFELEAATPTQLAGRLGMRLTTFMDQLRLVEGRGHARRLPHPSDRRSYRVTLTTAGLEAHRGANRLFELAHRDFVEALPEGEESAQRALETVRHAADRARARARAAVEDPARG
jgi:DNA-binding MarR family transcriptional regulator